MALPKILQDFLDHAGLTNGAHGSTTEPAPNALPQSGDDGTLDTGWMPPDVVKINEDGVIDAAVLPETAVQTVDGKLPMTVIPDTLETGQFKSEGDAASTGFLLADGKDLAEVFGAVNGVENVNSGSGAFVGSVALAVEGKKIRMTQTLKAASYCTYCACDCQCTCYTCG